MVAKTAKHIRDTAVRMYVDGASSTEASIATGIDATTVLKAVRECGFTVRSGSESKFALQKRHPKKPGPVDTEKIYGCNDEKICTVCLQSFPATVEHFYTKVRENGRRYFTPKCKSCTKNQRDAYRKSNPEAVKASVAKTTIKYGDKYNANRRARFAGNVDLRNDRNAKTREWFSKNGEYILIYRQAYRAANSDMLKRRAMDYYRANPEKLRAYRQVRKGRLRGAVGSFTAADLRKQHADQFGKCFWCRESLDSDYHADHYIPVAKGGNNKPYNMVLSCPPCNISRGAKMPVDFFAYRRLIADKMPEIERRREYFKLKMRERRARA